jgi:hypothetical protein
MYLFLGPFGLYYGYHVCVRAYVRVCVCDHRRASKGNKLHQSWSKSWWTFVKEEICIDGLAATVDFERDTTLWLG